MIAVIFESWPDESLEADYFDTAAEMGPLAEAHDGFISVERFESITEPGKFVSLSFFRDEEAVQAWRQRAEHRIAQAKGRAKIFKDYRLRVAEVVRDYSKAERAEVPNDSRAAHDAAEGAADTKVAAFD